MTPLFCGDNRKMQLIVSRVPDDMCSKPHEWAFTVFCFFPHKSSQSWKYLVGTDGNVMTAGAEPLGLVPKPGAWAEKLILSNANGVLKIVVMKKARKPSLKIVGPSTATGPSSPQRKLGEHGLALWRTVMAEYQIEDIGRVETLAQICAAKDRVESLRSQIDEDGEVVTIKGAPRPHLLLRDETNFAASSSVASRSPASASKR